MDNKFLDDRLLYQFVSAAFGAKGMEKDTGVGSSWVDLDLDGDLEESLPAMSSKDEEKFECQLKKAVGDTEIERLFQDLESLEPQGDSEEDEAQFMEEREEIQDDIKSIAKEYLKDYII